MKIEKNGAQVFEFAIPFLLIVIASLFLIVTDLDLIVSGIFFDTVTKDWFLKNNPWVVTIYQFGPIISAVIFLGSVILLFCSYILPRFFFWRSKSYLIIFCILVAPLFLTHVVVKEVWKRPRPRDTIQFSGNHEFQRLLTIADHDFKGKSFPSGHSTAGYILVVFYFLLKRKKGTWAKLSLLLSILLGSWLSYARVAAGGHYLSDTIWSFALCWFTAYFLYYWWYLPYDKKNLNKALFEFKKKRVVILLSVLIVIATGIVLGTKIIKPFRRDLADYPVKISKEIRKIRITSRVQKGDIHLIKQKREDVLVRTWSSGEGPEEIRTIRNISLQNDGKLLSISLSTQPSTWFWTYQSHISFYVPEDYPYDLDLQTKLGTVFLPK